MKAKAIIVALTLVFSPMQSVLAQSEARGSQGSAAVSAGSGTVLTGSLDIAANSGELVVASVETIGESTHIVLNGVSTAAAESVKIAISAAAGASVAVGTTVQIVALSTGYSIMAAGIMLAYIPNEVGRSLLYHQRVGERRL
jgi:hypothetical protein